MHHEVSFWEHLGYAVFVTLVCLAIIAADRRWVLPRQKKRRKAGLCIH